MPVAIVIVFGTLASVLVHDACFKIEPIRVPEAGTPRAHYCNAVVAAKPWLLFVLVPTVLVVLCAARAPRFAVALAIVLTAVTLATAIVANSLTSTVTI